MADAISVDGLISDVTGERLGMPSMPQSKRASRYVRLFLGNDFRLLWLASITATTSEMAVGVTITWGTWENTGSATAVGLKRSLPSTDRAGDVSGATA